MSNSFSEFPENPLNLKKKPNPNVKSFWAFLSSIFIYISAFYIFNLSPSTLFCTTKFWFFISNTLVLIIATDFAAFAAAKRPHFDEENVITYTTKATDFPSTKVVSFKTTASSDEEEQEEEKIINTVDVKTKREECERSNSVNAAAEEEEKAVVLHRTMSEGHDVEDVSNEFSRMSDEELNKRVEEFIRRFNSQIRLQAVRNRQNLDINANRL